MRPHARHIRQPALHPSNVGSLSGRDTVRSQEFVVTDGIQYSQNGRLPMLNLETPSLHVSSVPAGAEARATRALERLCGQVDALRTRPLAGEDFERVERELHQRFVEAEREVLGELLDSLDVTVASVEIGDRRYHRVLNSTGTYTTAVWAVKVRRTLYRRARERAVVPMELRVGMIEGRWTPLAVRQASCVVAQMTPKEDETLLLELGNMAPSKSSRLHGNETPVGGPGPYPYFRGSGAGC